MKKNRRHLRRHSFLDDIADRPPQRRTVAETERLAALLDTLPASASKQERSATS